MTLCKDLVGKSVVTIDKGQLIGEVKDICFLPDLTALAGIHLGKQGLLRRKSLVIPAEAVMVFGIDVILVENDQALTDDKELPEAAKWLMLDKLEGREVDTVGGTKIGSIGDVVLDENGKIIAFTLSRINVEGPLAQSRLVYAGAIIDYGLDGAMTIDLSKAEQGSSISAQPVQPVPSREWDTPIPVEKSEETPAPTSTDNEPLTFTDNESESADDLTNP